MQALAFPTGAGGLSTMRLECRLVGSSQGIADGRYLLVDVREPNEVAAEAYPDAVVVPLSLLLICLILYLDFSSITDTLLAASVMPMALIGGVFALSGAVGLVRLPDFFMRLHAPTKATTLGVGGMLIASMLYFAGEGEFVVLDGDLDLVGDQNGLFANAAHGACLLTKCCRAIRRPPCCGGSRRPSSGRARSKGC